MKRLACLIIASILLFSFVLIAPVSVASQTALPDHLSPMKYVSDTSSVPDSLAKPMGKPVKPVPDPTAGKWAAVIASLTTRAVRATSGIQMMTPRRCTPSWSTSKDTQPERQTAHQQGGHRLRDHRRHRLAGAERDGRERSGVLLQRTWLQGRRFGWLGWGLGIGRLRRGYSVL